MKNNDKLTNIQIHTQKLKTENRHLDYWKDNDHILYHISETEMLTNLCGINYSLVLIFKYQ